MTPDKESTLEVLGHKGSDTVEPRYKSKEPVILDPLVACIPVKLQNQGR